MKVTAKTTAPCQQRLEIHLPPQDVTEAYDAVYAQIQREAVIPGFRKGKAPRDLLAKQHSQTAREEVLKRLIGGGIEQATQERHWHLVGRCDVSDVALDDATGLKFVAEVEVAPEIKLGAYKAITLQRPAVTVTDEDVARALAMLQERHAEMTPTGSGEQKEKQVPALDDAFAKDRGFETLEALRAKVRLDLTTHRQQESRRAVEEQLFATLLHQSPFQVPPSLVQRQAERLKQHLTTRLLMSGLAEAQIQPELAKLEQEFGTNAERQVQIRFLLDRIAEQEHIAVSQEELVRQLWSLARRTRQDPSTLRRQLDEQGAWEGLAAEVRYEKTVDFLLKAAKIEDAPAPAGAASAQTTTTT